MLNYFTSLTAKLFFILALFPYVSFGTNSMDSQPHFIILAIIAILFFLYSGPIFSKSIYLFLLMIISLFTISIYADNFDFMYLRSIGSYVGFFSTLIAAVIYFDRYGIPIKTIAISNVVYLVAAIIQFFSFDQKNEVLDFLIISNTFSTPLRGVIGLTPEPTIFATLLFFYSWVLLIIFDYLPSKRIQLLICSNILAILFLTKSTMVFVFLIVASAFVLLRFFKKKSFVLLFPSIIICFALYLYLMPQLFPNSRFVNITAIFFGLEGNLLERIAIITSFDASINDRVLNAFAPYFGFIINYGLPGGIESYREISKEFIIYTDGYFWAGIGSNKILSFLGAFIYELGFIGVICISYLFILLKDPLNSNRQIELCLLFVLLNSSIPVAFSLIPILMALMYYKKRNTLILSVRNEN